MNDIAGENDDRNEFEPEAADDRESRIREIAYFLWEQEGYPDGQADRHWAAAEAVVDAEDEDREAMPMDPRGEPLTPPHASDLPLTATGQRRKAGSR